MKLAKIESVYRQNLLINGDFQINQRGESSYSSNLTYTLDMWYLSTNGGSISLSTDGLNVNAQSSPVTIQQFVDEDYRGKQMTVVIKFKNVIYSHTFNVSTDTTMHSFTDTLGVRLYYDTSKNKTCFWMRCQNDSGLISYADLFEGSVAYDHMKEDKATALMRCRKYVLKLPVSYSGYTGSTSNIYIVYPEIMEMFSSPSIDTMPTTIRCVLEGGVNTYNVSEITINQESGEMTIKISSPPSSLAYKSLGGWFDKAIILSCEP